MRPRPLISYCIATYNRGRVLVDCLRKTYAQTIAIDPNAEFLVVDNASNDDTRAQLKDHAPFARVIPLERNEGPVAKNHALRQARGQYVVILDDDAYPNPGALPQMVRHFQSDPHLAAAVFDVTLPDGTKEASAFPDVFIGAGTAFRKSVLDLVGLLPQDYFMQAEEYDLSFRILAAGYTIQRFWDMPLTHLKTPNARIGQRTTRLDVRNNLYLLARYIPDPLCHQLAADWLARYFAMAKQRDATQPASAHGTHKAAYMTGAAEGLAKWSLKRDKEKFLLDDDTVERIFKFDKITQRLDQARAAVGFSRVLLADYSKSLSSFTTAAGRLGIEVAAVADDNLGGEDQDYRGTPIRRFADCSDYDAIVVANLSPVAAPRRTAALQRLTHKPVINLFDPMRHLVGKPVASSQ